MKRILIIVDMQKDFTNGVLGNAECEAAVQKIANIVNQESYDFILLTRDTHYDNYLETQEGKKLPIAHCIKDTDGWQIREEIMNAVSQKYRDSEYKIVDKEFEQEIIEDMRRLCAELGINLNMKKTHIHKLDTKGNLSFLHNK